MNAGLLHCYTRNAEFGSRPSSAVIDVCHGPD